MYHLFQESSQEVFGPYTIEDLQKLQKEGHIGGEDQICDESENWCPWYEFLPSKPKLPPPNAPQKKQAPKKRVKTSSQNTNKYKKKVKKSRFPVFALAFIFILTGLLGSSYIYKEQIFDALNIIENAINKQPEIPAQNKESTNTQKEIKKDPIEMKDQIFNQLAKIEGNQLNTELRGSKHIETVSMQTKPTITQHDSHSAKLPKLLVGADMSALHNYEKTGVTFYDLDGNQADAYSILKKYGSNIFRLRLFVNPKDKKRADNDLNTMIEHAKRIKKLGLYILLDLHYSDTWADPGDQEIPHDWATLSFNDLVKKVETYTTKVLSRFKEENCLPELVQIGNEITPGMLFPHAKINKDKETKKDYNTPEQWDKLSMILKSGIKGIENVTGKEKRPKIVLHITCASWWKGTDRWFSNITERGVDFDIIGQSYYPDIHGPLNKVKETMDKAIEKFKKDYLFVELAYPAHDYNSLEKKTTSYYKEAMNYSLSVDGQRSFTENFLKMIKETDRAIGAIWWFPESVSPPVWKNMKKAGIKPHFNGWKDGATALWEIKNTKTSLNFKATARESIKALSATY